MGCEDRCRILNATGGFRWRSASARTGLSDAGTTAYRCRLCGDLSSAVSARVGLVEWVDDIEVADWWIPRLRPFSDYVVGSLVPTGFDAVTRIFHPIEDEPEGTRRRWSDVAAANGRIAHAHMQLHRIASRPDEHRDHNDVPWVDEGTLPLAEMHALASILLANGSTGATWFGFTTIYSTFHKKATAEIRPAGTFERKYFLIRGTLATIDDVCRYANDCPLDSPGLVSPTIWWPDDMSWFVAGDTDFAWTYAAGQTSLIETIESSPALEAFRSDYNRSDTLDADTLNEP